MSSTLVIVFIAVIVLGANLAFVLRPIRSDPKLEPGGEGGWFSRHYCVWLCLGRGTLNGSVATLGLIRVGYPLPASIAEGVTAGFLSGFFQLTVMNERFSAYLNRANNELHRMLKWAWFQALFYGLVKAAGTLAGGGPGNPTALLLAYAATITFGSAQYPWEAAIAARRALGTDQGVRRDRIRFIADMQTMAVSVTCVGMSILNSVGAPGSRLFLVGVGAMGLTYYGLVRLARQRWSRSLAAHPVCASLRRPLPRWSPGLAAPLAASLLALPGGAAHAASKHRARAASPTLVTTPVALVVTPDAPFEPAGPARLEDADTIVTATATATATAEAARARPRPLALPANPVVFTPGDAAPRGYIPIPSVRTALRVAGFLKLDAIHDTGPYTGDASDLPNLPLRGGGVEQRHGLTRLHARESRLSLGTFTDTAAGPVVAFLEVDFFGAAGANTYGLRMRHAYLSWGHLLAGHTYSNFLDTDARGTTIEFNGPTAAGNRKRAQLRLTYASPRGLTAALAVENGAADYTAPDGTRVVAADSLLAGDSPVVQQVPDLTAQLRHDSPAGHVAARGMLRQLRVLAAGGQGPALVRYGYGLALSGRWLYHGSSNLFAQVSGGEGIGGYVDDLDGQAATFDLGGQRLIPQLGYATLAGAEQYLSSRWRFNLIASVSGIRQPPETPIGPDVAPISRQFLQLFANLLFSPTPDLLIGLEYGYYRRDTNTPLSGWSNRFQLAILYRFGG